MELDNHPIPQDVSHFQFKLAGDMTVKELGYLGGGFIFAWIVYAIPGLFIIKLPFILMSAGSGIILTFVPIGGRPADLMIRSYFRALFVPNQYLFQKDNSRLLLQHLTDHIVKTPMPQMATIQSVVPTPAPVITPVEKPAETVTIKQTFTPLPQKPQEDKHLPIIGKSEVHEIQSENEEAKEKNLEQALESAKKAELDLQGSAGYGEAHEKVMELEKQVKQYSQDKANMEQELIKLRKQVAEKEHSQAVKPIEENVQQTAADRVKKLPQGGAGYSMIPDVPNIITGIIKDSRGNMLSNILIEVKDREGNPVRAFKTNQLGQFASATPLLNGTYTVTFEDSTSRHKFDTVEIVANGSIFTPIEVTSIDQREELRKQLFG